MGLLDIFRRKPKSLMDVLESSPAYQAQKELFDAMSALREDGFDADELPNGSGEYGLTPSNPIPCRTIFGIIAYLGRLRAPDGAKVAYERLYSMPSPVSPRPIDVYQVKHPAGQELAKLYISPEKKQNRSWAEKWPNPLVSSSGVGWLRWPTYQKRISGKAPRGFLLAENPIKPASNSGSLELVAAHFDDPVRRPARPSQGRNR